jgi:Polyketide cyclase / dehydrase and lipid transport
MPTLLLILGIVAVLIVALVVFISTRPGQFRVERSAQVGAPADIVFPLINDFHQWIRWSPFEKFDPKMTKTFEGPPAGPGASYAWNGNNKAGAGRTTILDSKPCQFISIKLEMFRPFACTNQVTFKLAPSAAGTLVSWIMEGKSNFIFKAVSLFMNMDAMVGKDFEEGLANLNTLAQAAKTSRQVGQSAPATR